MYIELHARSAFSFLEGASVPEELAEVCAAPSDAGDGLARSRWSIWRAALSSGNEEARPQSAHWGGDHFPADVRECQRTACPPASALCFARGLPESLPPDNAHEAARAEVSGCFTAPHKARGRYRPAFSGGSVSGRSQRVCDRADLSHRWRRRSTCLCVWRTAASKQVAARSNN